MGLALVEPAPNQPRYAGRRGHVESYFWRANDPARPRALWVKATILAPQLGQPVAEAWLIWFDGERSQTLAHRVTVPLAEAAFPQSETPAIHAAGLAFDARGDGSIRGHMDAPWGRAALDLRWSRDDSPIAAPLSIFPSRLLREGPFPRSKTLTPFPSLRFGGTAEIAGEQVSLQGWSGMQGHNWGREHAFEYAWGQCLFPAHGREPEAMLEGFTGRVKLGGRTTPRMSALVVRRGEYEYRFDRILDFWNQHAELDRERWSLRLTGPGGEARLRMDAAGKPMACLGYRNPDGQLSYCFNSKLAKVELQVQPRRGGAFELHSGHGGALEFLRREPDPKLPVI